MSVNLKSYLEMMKTAVLPILILLFLCSCNGAGNIFGGNIVVNIKDKDRPPYIEQVKVQNDQLVVSGRNLDRVVLAKVGAHDFQIESKTSDKLVLNAKSALSFFVGSALNLVVSNSEASATFPLNFELQNGQVTASKLHHMNASTGDFLQFDGTTWGPASISTNQVYVGTYNAATDTPVLSAGVAAAGTYYIVTTAGSQDLGSGVMSFDVGDWVISDGTNWSKVAVGTNTVSNFNGRKGAVVPLSGDYSWSMLTKAAGKLTGSKLQEIADVDVTGIQDGDILIWNNSTSKWESGPQPSVSIPAGSVTNTQIASGAVDSSKIVDGSITNADIAAGAAIDQTKISNLTTDLGNKEPKITAGTAAQYWSGTKTWQNLNPAVIGSTLTGYSASAGAVTAADTILSAINKLSGNIGLATASQSNYVLKGGDSMSGPLAMGGNKITNLADPTVATDAANKNYVDTQLSNNSYWTKVGSDINYTTGQVGVGVASFFPDMKLQIEQRLTNDAGRALNADTRQHSSVNGSYSALGGVFKAQATVDAGVVNSGSVSGSWSVGFRNNLTGTIDNGTLASLRGSYLQYGHYDSEAASTPITTEVMGLYLSPYYKKGTITNLYDIYAHPGSPGGTVTNFYGLHFSGSHKKHYLEGNLGLNKADPTEKLDVVGNIAVDGKVRFKSDNANFVELRAPAGLAGTIAFNLPGTAGSSGQALVTDGAGNLSWSTVSSGAIADGSIGYAKLNLANGDIPLAKLAGSSDATKYLKGDKTWGTFITDVLASTFATVTPSNTAIANGDSLQTVVNKTQGQINNLVSTSLNKTGIDSVTGTMTIAPAGVLKISNTATGADLTEATNVQYVQNYVGSFGQWNKNGSALYTDKYVGFGNNSTPSTFFHAIGTGGGDDDMMIDSFSDTAESAIMLRRARGTAAAPTPPLTNDRLGFLGFRALTVAPSTYVEMARVQGSAETDIATSMTGYLQFWTRNNGTYAERVRITGAGNVGIGTTAPDKKLVVIDPTPIADGSRAPVAEFSATATAASGGAKRGIVLYGSGFNGSVAIGKNTNAPLHFLNFAGTEVATFTDNGYFGLGTTSPSYPFNLDHTSTVTAGTTAQMANVFNVTPAAASTANYFGSLNTTRPSGAQDLTGHVHGNRVIVDNSNTGTIANVYGQYTETKNASTGTMTVGLGYRGVVNNASTGTISNARGVSVAVINGAAGAITNAYGVHIDPLSNPSGTVTNYYGLYIGSVLAAAGNKYGIYSVDGANYFGGTTGIGTTPTLAQLHVRGGANLLALQADASTDHGYLSFYTDSDATNTRTGFIGYATAGTNIMTITNQQSSDVYIGVSGYKNNLTINGTATTCVIGNGTASTSCTSDARLKDEVHAIPDALRKFLNLEGVFFTWNEKANTPGKPGMGVIAQKVEKEFPLAVTTDEKTGYKRVDYASLISPLIEAFKSFYQEFQGTKRSIASYEKKQVELEKRVKTLEEQNKQLLNIICRKDPSACKNP
ncbi:tail fiber domain-containing protein [Peredibacter sp. HCB2-198]|uniref:tail fiber domain-containing protein n=1 Tax=Peredibacter sp. HCB2-198 TaxID=3383025 RepID=UPI0038B4B3D2